MPSSTIPAATFRDPPLTEVSFSCQFEALPITAAHLGLAAAELRRRGFPRLEEHPPLPPVIEDLSTPFRRVEIVVQLAQRTSRIWCVSENGSDLIQMQPDRFVLNWRKVRQTDAYPSFANLSGNFATHLRW